MNNNYYYIDKNGQSIDISDTLLIQDYVGNNCIPPKLDQLLDWRSRLSKLKESNNDNHNIILSEELKAVDYLIQVNYCV